MNKLNVLSLFDGISCGQIALERAGIPVDKYFASEIDKNAIKVAQHNYPETVQLGDVTKVSTKDLPQIGLILAGSPCQGFSFAGKQLNFEDPRSKLFFEFVRLLKEVRETNPDVLFLLENVKMKKEYQKTISDLVGVEGIEINSSLLSAQNRKRIYWTNIPNVTVPKDIGLKLQDIVEANADYVFIDPEKTQNQVFNKNYLQYDMNGLGNKSQSQRASFLHCKSLCLDTTAHSNAKIFDNGRVRKMTRLEVERLQTVPDNYTSVASEAHAKKALGNGWTVDIISHILKGIKDV
jgi:DNA-cytosine methyltransferase